MMKLFMREPLVAWIWRDDDIGESLWVQQSMY